MLRMRWIMLSRRHEHVTFLKERVNRGGGCAHGIWLCKGKLYGAEP